MRDLTKDPQRLAFELRLKLPGETTDLVHRGLGLQQFVHVLESVTRGLSECLSECRGLSQPDDPKHETPFPCWEEEPASINLEGFVGVYGVSERAETLH